MRTLAIPAVLAAAMGSAYAGSPEDPMELQAYDASDFSARVFYRVDFGGAATRVQGLGFRVDNDRAFVLGAPALFQTRFGSHGVTQVTLNGLDLRAVAMRNQQDGDSDVDEVGFWEQFSPMQWAGIGFSSIVLITLIAGAADSDDTVAGTGGS